MGEIRNFLLQSNFKSHRLWALLLDSFVSVLNTFEHLDETLHTTLEYLMTHICTAKLKGVIPFTC